MGPRGIRSLTAGIVLGSIVLIAAPATANAHVSGRAAPVAPSSASAAAADTWTTNPAPLPGTLPSGLPAVSAQLNSTSCSSTSFCVAVGYVVDSGDYYFPLVETYTGGSWTASLAPEPSDAVEGGSGVLYSVSCPTDGTCAAVGDMFSSTGTAPAVEYQDGLLETLSGGTWSGSMAAVPGGVDPGVVNINAVSCGASGSCVAMGSVTNFAPTPSVNVGLIYTLSAGSWTLQTAPLPSDYNGGTLALASVSCPDSADCVAVGTYSDSASIYEPLILTLASGTWTPSQSPVPANGATTQSPGEAYPGGQLYAVSCPLVTYCVAGGYYTVSDYSQHPLLVTIQSGTATATEGPVPADAQADPLAAVNGVSCTGVDACVAAGSYWITFNTDENGMILTQQSDGSWTVAEDTMGPARPVGDRAKRARDKKISLQGVSCVSTSFCRAVGSNGTHGLIEKTKKSRSKRQG
jgi:hypothetical protein